MAEKDGYTAIKDEKQLKKERKDQERLQKEREKQEKKLEKERKKQEERERKEREREAKAQRIKAQQEGRDGAKSSVTVEPTASQAPEKPARRREAVNENGPEQFKDTLDTPQPPTEGEDTPQVQSPAVVPVDALADVSVSWPEKVTVAEPPGQITDCGQPIGIVFDTTQAGEGTLKASCKGAQVGDVPTSVTELKKGSIGVVFTPNSADIYTLSVQWGQRDITGSPFSINLSLLSSPPREVETTQQREVKEEKEEEEEEVEEISDDPFEMAFQASRLLEEQRRLAELESAKNPTKVYACEPSPPPNPVPAAHSKKLEHPPHQPSRDPQVKLSTEQRVNTSHVPYPVNGSLPFMPQPVISPAREEEMRYLQEVNKSLQDTNTGLGGEVADLKKKMGEFEAKLNTIEESSRIADEEKKELMGHMNMRGWLYKRGIKGPTANVWRQRYFRCDQGSKICYYKSSDETVPRGHIDLAKIESIVEVVEETQSDATDSFCFNITCGERTYELRTDSEDNRKQWMTTTQYLKNWYEKNPSALSPPRLS